MAFYPHLVWVSTGTTFGVVATTVSMTCLVVPQVGGGRKEFDNPVLGQPLEYIEKAYGIYCTTSEYELVRKGLGNPQMRLVWFEAPSTGFNPFHGGAGEIFEIQDFQRFSTHVSMRVTAQTVLF